MLVLLVRSECNRVGLWIRIVFSIELENFESLRTYSGMPRDALGGSCKCVYVCWGGLFLILKNSNFGFF